VGRPTEDKAAAEQPCHCVLIAEDESTDGGVKRLAALIETSDGFEISAKDLEIRGPEDVLGTRQSGGDQGKSVTVGQHWGMITSAARRGRMFLGESKRKGNGAEAKEIVAIDSMEGLFGGQAENAALSYALKGSDELVSLYTDIRATSAWGTSMRVNIALFGDWNQESEDAGQGGGARGAFEMLQDVCKDTYGENGEGEEDKAWIKFSSAIANRKDGIVKEGRVKIIKESGEGGEKSKSFGRTTKVLSDDEAAILSGREDGTTKERMKRNLNLARGNGVLGDSDWLQKQREEKKRAAVKGGTGPVVKELKINIKPAPKLSPSETCFLIIDVETTGLSKKTARIIQLAAKVLGSSDPEDR
jgi:hypothetical protein